MDPINFYAPLLFANKIDQCNYQEMYICLCSHQLFCLLVIYIFIYLVSSAIFHLQK